MFFVSNSAVKVHDSKTSGPEVIKNSCSPQLIMQFLNDHKYVNIKKFSFSGSGKLRMLSFLLINVKMPKTVAILTLMSRKKIRAQLS